MEETEHLDFVCFWGFSLAAPLSVWDLISLTRDQSLVPALDADSSPLNHQGRPSVTVQMHLPSPAPEILKLHDFPLEIEDVASPVK